MSKPPYYPDVGLCDLCLVPKLKIWIQGCCFAMMDGVGENDRGSLLQMKKGDF